MGEKKRERERAGERKRENRDYMTGTILKSIIHLVFIQPYETGTIFPSSQIRKLRNKTTCTEAVTCQSLILDPRCLAPKFLFSHYPIVSNAQVNMGLLNDYT